MAVKIIYSDIYMGIPNEISADINGNSKKTKIDGFGKLTHSSRLTYFVLLTTYFISRYALVGLKNGIYYLPFSLLYCQS